MFKWLRRVLAAQQEERSETVSPPVSPTGLDTTTEARTADTRRERADKSRSEQLRPSEQSEERGTQTAYSLYLDVQGTRSRQDLQGSLAQLRDHFGSDFFPGQVSEEDLIGAFLNTFFPDGLDGDYLISNIGLRDDDPVLMIRPSRRLPRMDRVLPSGITLALIGRVHGPGGSRRPMLRPLRVIAFPESPPRGFERRVRLYVHTSFDRQQRRRRRNVLSRSFLDELPPLAANARQTMRDWETFLALKERLARARARGVRYICCTVHPDATVEFLVVLPSEQEIDGFKRLCRAEDLWAFDLDVSEDQWQFRLRDRARLRGQELGEIQQGPQACTLPADVGPPWGDACAVHVRFRLNEADTERFEDICDREGVEAACERLQETFPAEGFLGVSIIGDLALVGRMRRALGDAQSGRTQSPFLLAYLSDVTQARVPVRMEEVPDGDWALPNLDDAQKRAVQVMLSAPELALIQGPPGTGKTTVIAEAIAQLARRGKKVLLVSQANLAVDNALERLPRIPEIRAIRLGSRFSDDLPYIPETALATYYRAVATRCEEQTLGPWRRTEEELAALDEWLSRMELAHQNWLESDRRAAELRREWEQLQQKLEAARQQEERNRQVRTEIESLSRCVSALKAGTYEKIPNDLPSDAVQLLVERLACPLAERMRRSRFRLDVPVRSSMPDELRLAAARELLLQWRKVADARDRIVEDIHLLREMSRGAPAPEVAIELASLKRRRDELVQQLTTDASVLAEFRQVCAKIEELQQSANRVSVDTDLYDDILVDPPSAEAIHANGPALAERLESYLCAIDSIDAWVKQEVVQCCLLLGAGIDRRRAECGPSHPTERAEALEAAVAAARSQYQEASQIADTRRQRIHELIQEAADRWQTPASVEHLQETREALSQRRTEIQHQLEETKTLRESWQPLLEWWTSALRDPDRAAADWSVLGDSYIESCNVVGISCTENPRTLDTAGHSLFDVVIVDEVSKVTLPEMLIPLLRAPKAILVGDHRQLPPLVREGGLSWDEVAEELGSGPDPQVEAPVGDEATEEELPLGISAEDYRRIVSLAGSMVFHDLFRKAPDQLKAFLDVQYRMHPQIMAVVNHFYEHRLTCGLVDPDGVHHDSDPAQHRRHELTLRGPDGQTILEPDQHVLWIDSTRDPSGEKHFEQRRGRSKANILEAEIIAHLLCEIELFYHQISPASKRRVGVVTFYAAQARQIRETVRRLARQRGIGHFRCARYDVNTVDRYQGRERPIVFVSLVRHPRGGLSERALTAQYQRINVALSRAQELLVIVGAAELFRRYHVELPFMDRDGSHRTRVYNLIWERIASYGGVLTARDILPRTPPDRPRRRSRRSWPTKRERR